MEHVTLIQEHDAMALRGGSEKTLLGTLLVIFPLGMLALAIPSGPLGVRIIGWVLFVFFGTIWVRCLRAGIRSEKDILILRTPLRTRKVPWRDIAEADVVPTNGNRIFGIVRITLRNGKRLKVDGSGNRWRRDRMDDTAVGQMAREINRRVAILHVP